MKKLSGLTGIGKLKKELSKAKAQRSLGLALMSLCVIAPVFEASYADGNRASQDNPLTSGRAWPGKLFDCGYDPLGAEDEWHNHKLNALRLNDRQAHSPGFT